MLLPTPLNLLIDEYWVNMIFENSTKYSVGVLGCVLRHDWLKCGGTTAHLLTGTGRPNLHCPYVEGNAHHLAGATIDVL